jgi:hypothetical protein
MMPALYGGLVIGVLSGVPFLNFVNCVCCAGVLLGGFIAVMLYSKNFTPEMPPMEAGDCAAVGVLAGVIGAVVDTGISLFVIMTFGNVLGDTLMEVLTEANIDLPEETWDQLRMLLDEETAAVALGFNFLVSIFIMSLFGLLGGLIGFTLFRPKPPLFPTTPPPRPPALP